jgi:hypothetical protein
MIDVDVAYQTTQVLAALQERCHETRHYESWWSGEEREWERECFDFRQKTQRDVLVAVACVISFKGEGKQTC